jgi:putative ABC transport system ATP-binding protein
MALHLHQLTKRYVSPDGAAVPVIDIDSFTLAGGEQVALVGGSGTGKTTLLHLIAGILTPDRGRILFSEEGVQGSGFRVQERRVESRGQFPADQPLEAREHLRPLEGGLAPSLPPASEGMEPPTGTAAAATEPVLDYHGGATGAGAAGAGDDGRSVDITQLSEAERDVFRGRHIGYIFQTHHLLPGFTALENVLLGMSFTGRPHDRGWARHLLDAVGLSDRLNYKPGKLSVGQQQRVAVARALANRPRLVLADEPTGALDPKTAQQVLDLIRKLCEEVGAGLLLVSHDPEISRQLPRVVSLAELNRASQ